MNKSVAHLRQAMACDPCEKHRYACPVGIRKCHWGHGALEFAEICDDCAKRFLYSLKRPLWPERLHHTSRKEKP